MLRIDKISNVEWTKKFVNENIDKIELNWSLYPNKTTWNCNCHVVFDSENDFLIRRIDFDFLRKKYTQIISQYCYSKGQHLDKLGDIWYNYYKINQYQESHNHISDDHIGSTSKEFVCVHFLIYDPEVHSKLMFEDQTLVVPEVSSGDILIFSGEEYHYVNESKTDSPRLTIAFGFAIK